MKYLKQVWKWIDINSKQLEIILLIFTSIFAYQAYNSSQSQVFIMNEQLESDKTYEKLKIIHEHYNQYLSVQPIFRDYIKNGQFGNSYKNADIRSFLDEFEYVKTIRDIGNFQDKTLGIFYRRTLIDACKNKQIMDIAIQEDKSGFLALCKLTDQMKP